MDLEILPETITHGMDEEFASGSYALHISDGVAGFSSPGLDAPKPDPRKNESSPIGRCHLPSMHADIWYDCLLETRNDA